MQDQAFGKTQWAIGEGYIPQESTGDSREMTSHEALCFLNTGAADAEIQLWIYFTDKKPQGPYLFTVPAERSFHLRMNDLKSPAPVPKGTEYSCYLQASQPVVVQHTRLDSRQAANALMTTIAYGE